MWGSDGKGWIILERMISLIGLLVLVLGILRTLARIEANQAHQAKLNKKNADKIDSIHQFISDKAQAAIQQQEKEPIPWENLIPELKKHMTPASENR